MSIKFPYVLITIVILQPMACSFHPSEQLPAGGHQRRAIRCQRVSSWPASPEEGKSHRIRIFPSEHLGRPALHRRSWAFPWLGSRWGYVCHRTTEWGHAKIDILISFHEQTTRARSIDCSLWTPRSMFSQANGSYLLRFPGSPA